MIGVKPFPAFIQIYPFISITEKVRVWTSEEVGTLASKGGQGASDEASESFPARHTRQRVHGQLVLAGHDGVSIGLANLKRVCG